MLKPLAFPTKLAGNPKKTPTFATTVKSVNKTDLSVVDPKATRALISLMDMHAVLGGAACHYGGPAALAELMSALHGYIFEEAEVQKKQWHELFNIVNDVGHAENGLYALKANYEMAGLTLNSLKDFRSMTSKLTGHGECHLFPEGVFLSNGPLGSTLPQSQGVALADKLAGNGRVTVSVVSDGASMEGEAREAFAAIPGLAANGGLAPYVMIISDNNTKLTGRIDSESFSMTPTFRALETLGWKVVSLDGHNLQACYDTIAAAIKSARENPKQPVAIHARTIKGIGTKKTADSSSGGHGFPLKAANELPAFLKEIYNNETYPKIFDEWIEELVGKEARIKAAAVKDTGEKIQKGVASALIRACKEGLPIVSVTSDLPGSTGVADFRKEFPQNSIDVGVAESNMVSSAAGLSKVGYIPVVDTFAQFGVTKGALPHTMASLSEAPVIAVYSHTGFQDAADGASHQALSYLSMMGSIPHVDVYALTCSEEADALVYQAVKKFAQERQQGKTPNSVIFFLGRENFAKSYAAGASYQLGQAQVVADTAAAGKKAVTLAVAGSLIPQAVQAAEKLSAQGIGSVIVNVSCLNHIDVATLKSALAKTGGNLVTVEDHQLIGGLGAILTHALATNGVAFKVKSLGVHGEFGQSAYNAIDLYKKHGLDAEAIVRAAGAL